MAEPNGDARNNQNIIQAIKEKYASARNITPTPQKPADSMPYPPNNTLRSHLTNLQSKTLNSNPSYARLDRSYLPSTDYDTLRRKYEDRSWQAPSEPPKKNAAGQEEGAAAREEESTNKSSPIKRFYETGKAENFLAVRRQEIQQAHQARANQHRAERELDQRAIASIDSLLASIRNTFSGYKYQSK